MKSPSYQCDYLDLPRTFICERAELAHIDGQISSLQTHISELTTLHHALLRRSRQLRNSLLPIHKLPIEILSHIFKQLVNPTGYEHYDLRPFYHRCLLQAFILASVSSHFRHVALGTPGLWKRVSLRVPDHETLCKSLSLLHHCSAFAPSLDISIAEVPGWLDEENFHSVFEALLTPDTTQKVKSLDFQEFSCPPCLWIDKFRAFGSPKLDTVCIWLEADEALSFDLLTFSSLTRLRIFAPGMDHQILLPCSLLYLTVDYITEEVLVSLLYQCPNLIECTVAIDEPEPDIEFTRPLTLPHLKRFTCSAINVITSTSSAENLHLPSLESLNVTLREGGALLLYRNVSATLTTLCINVDPDESNDNDLDRLQQTTFPRVQTMRIYSDYWGSHLTRVLECLEGDRHNSHPRFPTLKSIILRCHDAEPCSLLGQLRGTKIDRTFYFDIRYRHRYDDSKLGQWSPELREELELVVGGRQIEVTWGKHKIHTCRGGSI